MTEEIDNIPVVYVDMDDTIFNYKKAYWASLQINPGNKWPQSQYKFFEDLEPIPGAIDGVNTLKTKYKVFILTRPSVLNPLSYTEKRVSIEKHLGFDMCNNLLLCPDKTIARGNYLIDDVIQNGHFIPEWEHIHFGTEKFPDWNSVLNYLM
jgi:hypothetical protein